MRRRSELTTTQRTKLLCQIVATGEDREESDAPGWCRLTDAVSLAG